MWLVDDDENEFHEEIDGSSSYEEVQEVQILDLICQS